MSTLIKQLYRPVFIAVVLFFLSLSYYGYSALNFPLLFNVDNHENYAATRYIAEHHKIPIVGLDNKELSFTDLGTTRSLRPPFTFIVSAIVSNLSVNMVENDVARQRLGSPLIAAITLVVIFAGFWFAFSHVGIALLGAVSIGVLPKFVFLASCNNDDIGAILSVSLLFSSILALIRYKHKTWILIALAISVGLILQSKFTAWLVLPWFMGLCLILLKPVWPKVIKLMPILLLVCVVSGAWWPIFNMVNYGINDPTALNYAAELQRESGNVNPNQQGYAYEGVGLTDLLTNHDQFLSKSYKSFIGYLDWLKLDVGHGAYFFYGVIFLVGIVGVFFRSRTLLNEPTYLQLLILMLIVSQCLFYLHHNLVRDIQPQARYILPIIMPAIYLFLSVISRIPSDTLVLHIKGAKFHFQPFFSAVFIVLLLSLYVFTLNNYITPSFLAKPFYTTLKKPKNYKVEDGLKVLSASALNYSFSNGKLELERTSIERPTLELDPAFCKLLPTNALVTMNVSSNLKGGFYLRLDRDYQGTYDSLHWRSFPAGNSVSMFSVNGQNCTGVQITLAKNTYRILLDNLQISELKIHKHGNPI